MRKNELRNIDFKNYLILGVIIIVTILLVYGFSISYNNHINNKMDSVVMDKYLDVINYNELDDYLIENPNAIIYVSIIGDEDIRNFEVKFKNSFKYNRIENDVLYLDLSDEISNDSILKEIDDKYTVNSLSISSVPCIAIFKDGKIDSVYSIKNNNYDVKMIESFINSVEFDING